MSKEQFYPHAVKYITAEGIATASKETLETWEYEASICSQVEMAVADKDAVGRLACPNCQGRIFRYSDIIVNYEVPFVSTFRVITIFNKLPADGKVQCISCRMFFGNKSDRNKEVEK